MSHFTEIFGLALNKKKHYKTRISLWDKMFGLFKSTEWSLKADQTKRLWSHSINVKRTIEEDE